MTAIVPQSIGEWLREQRLARAMTLRSAADLFGVQLQTYWRWENKHSIPAERYWGRIGAEFGATLKFIKQLVKQP